MVLRLKLNIRFIERRHKSPTGHNFYVKGHILLEYPHFSSFAFIHSVVQKRNRFSRFSNDKTSVLHNKIRYTRNDEFLTSNSRLHFTNSLTWSL